jgi:hypothetical protein
VAGFYQGLLAEAVTPQCTGPDRVFGHENAWGFMIGRQVEHGRLLGKAMLMQQAVAMAGVPRLSVIIRKSFGLADHAMSGVGLDSDLLVAWPGAEISFMDPQAAASVLGASTHDEVTLDPSPYGAAGGLAVDEVIDPASTRAVLHEALDRAAQRPFTPGTERPLSTWPMSWLPPPPRAPALVTAPAPRPGSGWRRGQDEHHQGQHKDHDEPAVVGQERRYYPRRDDHPRRPHGHFLRAHRPTDPPWRRRPGSAQPSRDGGQLGPGPRPQRPPHMRGELVGGQPPLRERRLEYVDDPIAIGVGGPHPALRRQG